jgi:dienelactone hydrolase
MQRVPHLIPKQRAFVLIILIISGCGYKSGTSINVVSTLQSTSSPIGTLALNSSPERTPSPTVTLAPGQTASRIEFSAADGQKLTGYYYPSWKKSAPVVVLMHEYGNSQAAWQESAIIPWMQNWGAMDPTNQTYIYAGGHLPPFPETLSFAVFTFDFRGHGESISASQVIGVKQNAVGFLLDAQAAYDIASKMPGADANKVIGIGASIGADAVVEACDDRCSGAFSISPGNWLNLDYGKFVRKLIKQEIPVRCMYSVRDNPSPQTCWSIQPGKLYKIYAYPGIKHGMTFFVPRKMETGFGSNLLDFLVAASQ